MKGTNLGEFEELVMLVIGVLHPEAYGVSIRETLMEQTKRNITLSTVHAALHRLETKGFLESRFGEATKSRGGKRKKYFHYTASGINAMTEAREKRIKLWSMIPRAALETKNG